MPSITKEQCTSKGKELTQTFLAVDADFKSVYFWRERETDRWHASFQVRAENQ